MVRTGYHGRRPEYRSSTGKPIESLVAPTNERARQDGWLAENVGSFVAACITSMAYAAESHPKKFATDWDRGGAEISITPEENDTYAVHLIVHTRNVNGVRRFEITIGDLTAEPDKKAIAPAVIANFLEKFFQSAVQTPQRGLGAQLNVLRKQGVTSVYIAPPFERTIPLLGT